MENLFEIYKVTVNLPIPSINNTDINILSNSKTISQPNTIQAPQQNLTETFQNVFPIHLFHSCQLGRTRILCRHSRSRCFQHHRSPCQPRLLLLQRHRLQWPMLFWCEPFRQLRWVYLLAYPAELRNGLLTANKTVTVGSDFNDQVSSAGPNNGIHCILYA